MIIAIAGALFVVVAIVALKMQRDKKLSAEERARRAEFAAEKRYRFLSTFFLTQGRINNISAALNALSVYRQGQVAVLTVRYFLTTLALQGGIVAVASILFSDIFSIMSGIIVAMFVGHVTLDREIEKINMRVYRQMSHLLSSVRQEYLRTASIPEALVSITPSSLMARPVSEIEDILTANNGEERLLKFYESSPFRMLQTFATVCFNVNNTGDEIDLVTGRSKFLDSLSLMASDVNAEILRLTLIAQKFRGLVWLPLVPLVGTPIAQIFLRSAMPGTTVIFDGLIGFVGNFITLFLTGLMFRVVATMSKSTAVSDDDRVPMVVNLYETRPAVRRFILKAAPKNAARRKEIDKMNAALSRKTPELMTLERLLFLAAGCIVGFALMFVGLNVGRTFVLNSTQNFGIVHDTSLDGFPQEQILSLDNAFLNRTYEWSHEYASQRISAALPGLSAMDVGEQVKRLNDKEAALRATNLHWWYLLLVYGFAVGVSYIPILLRRMRLWAAQAAAEEDFLQLQSLMAIVMCMGVDTIDALEQLCTNSRIHRPQLLYAYHSYPAHPEKELDRLKSKVSLMEFKRFCDKLKLTVVDLSLEEAFSDLLLEREHMVRMRELAMIDAIEKRRHLAGMYAKVPAGVMVATQMVIPIAYLGIREFSTAMGGLQGL
jgi:hypothetical protein